MLKSVLVFVQCWYCFAVPRSVATVSRYSGGDGARSGSGVFLVCSADPDFLGAQLFAGSPHLKASSLVYEISLLLESEIEQTE